MSVRYCPSVPVYEDGKKIGWFYGLHVVSAAPEEDETCPVCGMNLQSGGLASPLIERPAAPNADTLTKEK